MDLNDYFEKTKGSGVFATADKEGRVNAAVYSRPHILEDGTAAFIMRDRLTRANLKQNPFAVYLFREEGGYKGKRVYLEKISEEEETERLHRLKRRRVSPQDDSEKGPKFLVIFKITGVLPLIGDDES